MVQTTFEETLTALVQNFQLDGHAVVEQEGVYFARIEIIDRENVIVMTEINLTRIADQIAGRAS